MDSKPRISDAEWEIMKIIWKQAPVTSEEIINALSDKKDWSSKTVKSFLNRLVNKGAIGFNKSGRNYLYHALVSEEECINEESETFLNRIYDGAVEMLFSHYLTRKKLSKEEIDRLEKILVDQKKEN